MEPEGSHELLIGLPPSQPLHPANLGFRQGFLEAGLTRTFRRRSGL
jgi:hypothetical protein